MVFIYYLPCEHHHEVHDIPSISQVGVLVEGETKCQDLYSRLKAEDPYEVRLCIILRRESQRAKEARREKIETKESKEGRRKKKINITSAFLF